MRPIAECDTVQIELTSACVLTCSNCTRFVGHQRKPFFLSGVEFRSAIDSLVGFVEGTNGIVGIMGGEPLLSPHFEEFCEYALERIPRERLGLWSTFPQKFVRYREVICRTFGNILLNDHSRGDILHAPLLQASEEFFRNPDGTVNSADLHLACEHCWVQESWSASINPKGAWFCEVAAALSDLFDGPQGWDVEPDWWKRSTKDFTAQREWACPKCSGALPLARRASIEDKTDASPGNLERLRAVGARRLDDVIVHASPVFDKTLVGNTYPKQTYQEESFRKGIAARYGIGLSMTPRGYWSPYLLPDGWQPEKRPPSIFSILPTT